MTRVVDLQVEVLTLDVGCDVWGAALRSVPQAVGQAWLAGHRDPALLAVDMRINGSPSRWVRRRTS